MLSSIQCPSSITLAAVRLHRARKDLDQRALPRPVFADNGMNFPRAQIERDVLQSAHSAITFFDSLGLEEQSAIIACSVRSRPLCFLP